jgi:hypothetical protein
LVMSEIHAYTKWSTLAYQYTKYASNYAFW